jgi:tRNA nucleotidyltransferase/poly(A) polymerase
MRINYKPKTELEKFGVKIYNLLVENFAKTFFVGGMVRDLYLDRKIIDVDIATEATPEEVIKLLNKKKIITNSDFKKFGNVAAKKGKLKIEITTLRKDMRGDSRYHEVKFITSPKVDSSRRDFTINSLYLSLVRGESFDFYGGVHDIGKRLIKFIGNADKRIKEDPLRIIRGLRFALILNFKFEIKTKLAIKNNFSLIQNLSQSRIEKEISKIKNIKQKSILKKVINNSAYLDKYFK